jgi:glutathione S-transferase
MPDETTRAEVAQALAEQLGPRISAALMEVVPPFGWHEIATKADLLALEKRLDSRFDVVDSRFDVVDARFAAVDLRFTAVDRRFDAVDARFDAMRVELLGAMHQEGARQLRWMVTAMLATAATIGGIVTAVGALH